MEIPEHLELDVSGMGIGDSLRVADLPATDGITVLDDPDETVLASVGLPTRVEEPEEVLEAGEEGEAPPAAEAAAGSSEEPLEPGGDAAGSPGTVEG